ncbi:MAG TPA: hypothetical protein VLI67_09900 [Vicinamibacteria bacterium]|nr:hypothetical protein [Vicinamibacteria bacterium]
MTALLPHLERGAEVVRVEETPPEPPATDLDLYEIADDPAHAYAYRAAAARPGVLLLRDWSIHGLLVEATLRAGDASAYLREMRRDYGETGAFVARQVGRGRGGRLLPSLFPSNLRLLEESLGVVASTARIRSRAARRLPGRPLLELPLDLLVPALPVPARDDARRHLGLPGDGPVIAVVADDPEAARLPVVLRAVGRLRRPSPGEGRPGRGVRVVALEATRLEGAGLEVPLIVTGPLDTARLLEWLAAADVVVALRFPAPGGLPPPVVRALEARRPVLVTAGTPPAEELPAGAVVPVAPDGGEEDELIALLAHLLERPALCERIGAYAREHLDAARDPAGAARRLLAFLGAVGAGRDEARRRIAADRAEEGTLLGYALEEVRRGARDLGLAGAHLGLEPLLAGLLGGPSRERTGEPGGRQRSPPPAGGGKASGADEEHEGPA